MLSIILTVLYVVGLYKVFEKCHVEGWKAIVPVYNYYNLLKIVKRPMYYFYWIVIPYIACFSLVAVWGMTTFIGAVLGSGPSMLMTMIMPALLILSLIAMLPGVVFQIIVKLDLAKLFGKNVWFGIGIIIFPYIFIPILGLGKSHPKHGHVSHSTNHGDEHTGGHSHVHEHTAHHVPHHTKVEGN